MYKGHKSLLLPSALCQCLRDFLLCYAVLMRAQITTASIPQHSKLLKCVDYSNLHKATPKESRRCHKQKHLIQPERLLAEAKYKFTSTTSFFLITPNSRV